VEGSETVNLQLSSPTGGAVLGSPSSAVLTILDDEVPSPGQLHFAAANYNVREDGGTVTLTVTRLGGANGPVSVHYATGGGTAVAGTDYTAVSGTLAFADGQTSQSISVPILNDAVFKGVRVFNVTLSNPAGGAVLAPPTTSVVNIIDDETVVNDNVLFVSGLYHDALGRGASVAEIGQFVPNLDYTRELSLKPIALAFVTSRENRSNVVTRYYRDYLGRTPSAAEVNSWVARLEGTATPEGVRTAFLASPEYFQKTGGSNRLWVDQLYRDLLGRDPDPGSQTWVAQLNNGLGRDVVATAIFASTEYSTHLIDSTYQAYLYRNAGPADLSRWLPRVTAPKAGAGQPAPSETFLAGVIASQEYLSKNGKTNLAAVRNLYTQILGREGEAAGVQSHLGRLLAGYAEPRRQAAATVATSAEAYARLVQGVYTSYLGRSPTAAETDGAVRALQQGGTDEALRGAVLASEEYFRRQGSTNAGWLDGVYRDVLGRGRDAGSQGYLDQLNRGTRTRGQVAATILVSVEYRRRVIAESYQTYLRRPGTAGELDFWVNALQQSSVEAMAAQILATAEYFQRDHPQP
jgi:hypothetical protein